jgi:cephalosporin-C deacetylase-like acetyl esterase
MWILASWLVACAPTSEEPIDIGVDTTDPMSGTCGDGLIDAGEACDQGDANGTSTCACTTDCAWPDATTTCDDGAPCTVDDVCDGAGACGGVENTCDDHDKCTEDTCDPATGACVNDPQDGPLALFSDPKLRDPVTLGVSIIDHSVTISGIRTLDVYHLSYESFESNRCDLRPITLDAWLAIPTDASAASRVPGLVVAHGLGGWATESDATGPAGDLGIAVLAYTGPGGQDPDTLRRSEGTGSTPDHLFDVVDHPRNSWFWEHSVAAIRGLSLLEARPEVDPDRLGMSGFSGGGVATYLVNGVDPRVKAAMPVSATGHLDMAADNGAYPGWQVALLEAMNPPRDITSPEWQRYVETLDPKNFLATQHGPVLVANGAQDEFFPVHSFAATADDLLANSADHRFLMIPNWDHGWFALFNGDLAAERGGAAFQQWFRHHFRLRGGGPALPSPSITSVDPWFCTDLSIPYIGNCAKVTTDLGGQGWLVQEARIWWSRDGLLWMYWNLEEDNGAWVGEPILFDGAVDNLANMAFFVEFAVQDSIFSPITWVTSPPSVPPGFKPTILPPDGPLPL